MSLVTIDHQDMLNAIRETLRSELRKIRELDVAADDDRIARVVDDVARNIAQSCMGCDIDEPSAEQLAAWRSDRLVATVPNRRRP